MPRLKWSTWREIATYGVIHNDTRKMEMISNEIGQIESWFPIAFTKDVDN
jgi:hypothetical protein